jgi:HTH-type transcriptional regulator, transcriptional repressor of NAD biosynthesis genes
MSTIRVAILGAESTGKTSLCKALALALTTRFSDIALVPEALRQFCETYQRVPAEQDQRRIMHQQAALELVAENAFQKTRTNLVLSDCAPITTAIYSELYFSDQSLYEEASAHHARYDLSLLLCPNLGWQPDGLFRDSPEAQQRFHRRLKTWLAAGANPWHEISETGSARTTSALSAIITLLR